MKLDLNSNESHEVVIKFSSKLLSTSNIFCTFLGKLKVYALGRLQCSLNLSANLIYPEIEISTRELRATNNLLPRAMTFTLYNPSDTLSSSFELKFKENSTHIAPLEEKRQSSLMNIVQCLMKQKFYLKEKFFHLDNSEEEEEVNCVEEIDERENVERKSRKLKLRISQIEDQKLENIHDIIAKNYNVEATSKDIQKRFKSLLRTVSETQCSNNDGIAKVRQSSNTSFASCECQQSFLSLSQTMGTLKEGESRLISVYFSGSKRGKSFHVNKCLK